jgi:sugar/nucleoside kinase (ribokinase family)
MGTEILADKMSLSLGSSSAIFASNISVLGIKTAFAGMIGNDNFGELVLSSLKDKNVDTTFIKINDEHKTGLTVALNYDEDRAMVTYPGAMNHFSLQDIDNEVFESARHLHLSSIFLQEQLKIDVVALFQKAKQHGMTTSLDLQWDPNEKWDIDFVSLLPLVDVFLPNKSELFAITGIDDVEKALNSLKEKCTTIAVKMGAEGSVLFNNGSISYHKPYLNTKVVDAIGAGDSFNAGFVYALLNGYQSADCMDFGNLMGAINTTAGSGTGAFTSKPEIVKRAMESFNKEIDL